MREDEAQEHIKTAAIQARFRITRHADQRMRERGAQPADVRSALMTAKRCERQADGRWRLRDGVDLEGDELVCVVVIDGDVVVVTVF
jgi:Rad3-related DNA helicase